MRSPSSSRRDGEGGVAREGGWEFFSREWAFKAGWWMCFLAVQPHDVPTVPCGLNLNWPCYVHSFAAAEKASIG